MGTLQERRVKKRKCYFLNPLTVRKHKHTQHENESRKRCVDGLMDSKHMKKKTINCSELKVATETKHTEDRSAFPPDVVLFAFLTFTGNKRVCDQ